MFVCIVAAIALSGQHRHAMHHTMKPASPVDDEKAIRATAKKVELAFETKNLRLFESLITSDCTYRTPDHKVHKRKDMMQAMRAQFAPLSDIKANINIQDIQVMGKKAVVMDRFTMKGTITDKSGKHKFFTEGSETVSLRKVGNKWLAYDDLVHDQSTSIDGHVVEHMP